MFSFEGEFLIFYDVLWKVCSTNRQTWPRILNVPLNPKLVDSALDKLQKPQSMFNSLLFIWGRRKQTNKESLSLLWELWMLQSMQPVVKATSLCKYSPMMCILYKILLITYEQSLNYKLHGQNFLFSVTHYFSPHPFTQQSTAPLSPCIRLTACRLVNKAGRYKSC